MKKGTITKKTLIKKIKAIIAEYGAFTCADVEADSSPVITSLGKNTFQLAEEFMTHKVRATIYVHDHETDEDWISYEDLNRDCLEEIYYLAQEFEAMTIQDEKRQSN